MNTDGRAERCLAELDALISEYVAELEWQRQLGVMAACWPYTLRRPAPQIPTQRPPSPTEHRRAERFPSR